MPSLGDVRLRMSGNYQVNLASTRDHRHHRNIHHRTDFGLGDIRKPQRALLQSVA